MTLIRKLCAGDKCKHKRFLKANRLEREKNIKILNDLVNNDCTTVRECDDLNLAICGWLENTLNTIVVVIMMRLWLRLRQTGRLRLCWQ